MRKKRNIWIFVIFSIIAAIPSFFFPDLDIKVLGIRYHRFFLFHSVIIPYVIFLLVWKIKNKLIGNISLIIASGFSLGISIHLFTDLFGKKTINFFFINTLVYGTYADDFLWLMINMVLGFLLVYIVFRRYFRTP